MESEGNKSKTCLFNFTLAGNKIAYDDLNDEFGNVSVSGKFNPCLTGLRRGGRNSGSSSEKGQ